MNSSYLLSLSAFITFGVGALVATSDVGEWIPEIELFPEPEPVVVIIVGDPRAVERVSQVLPEDRIISRTPGAFAMDSERIVAASADAASGPLNELGWVSREIEIIAVPMDGGRRWEVDRSRRLAGGGDGEEVDPATTEKVAALMQKPTLNAMEASYLLRHMDATGQF